MGANRLGHVLQHLRKLSARQNAGHLEDRLLLERFVNDKDEAAFTELVARHGPMVLDVCRRVLHDPAAVDDAFQATFLVLVRKAASISKGDLLANWLYGVAYRTAARARVEAAKRRARESAVPAREAVDPLDAMTLRELFAVLDEELHGLPAKYRAPLVLCYLQNRTRDEAAQQSGCSRATLDRRLERGRALLKARMVRRGLTVGLALFPALLFQANVSGGVANSLAASTVKAATFVASGGAASSIVSPGVAILVEGVMKAMFMTKVKIVTAALLVAAIVSTAAVTVGFPVLAAQQPQPPKTEKATPHEGKDPGKDGAQKDVEKIQGSWNVVSYDAGGKPLGGDGRPKRLVIKNDEVHFETEKNETVVVKYRLDVAKKPKQLDMTLTQDGEKVTLPGIYHLEGWSRSSIVNHAAKLE